MGDGTYRMGKKTYSRSRQISRFDGLNFDCATSSNTFNCTNNFSTLIMRPSSLGGGRIMRRTLSVRLSVVCLSVRPSRYRSPKFFYFGCSLARRSKVNKGRISYGHLGRTDSCLPIHHTTFMALKYGAKLRPFTLRMPTARHS